MSRQATWRNRILPKVKRHKLPIRYRAVGMIKDGVTQVADARELGVNSATIKLWMDRKRSGETLKNSTVRGRKTALSREAKIVIAKSTFKSTI